MFVQNLILPGPVCPKWSIHIISFNLPQNFMRKLFVFISILQMRKLKPTGAWNVPKDTQVVNGRAGIWSQEVYGCFFKKTFYFVLGYISHRVGHDWSDLAAAAAAAAAAWERWSAERRAWWRRRERKPNLSKSESPRKTLLWLPRSKVQTTGLLNLRSPWFIVWEHGLRNEPCVG